MTGVFGEMGYTSAGPRPQRASLSTPGHRRLWLCVGSALEQRPDWSPVSILHKARERSLSHRSDSYPLFGIPRDFSGFLACFTESCINMPLLCDLSPRCWCRLLQSPSPSFASLLSFPQTQNSLPDFWVLEGTISGIMYLPYSFLLLCLLILSSCFGHQLRYHYFREAFLHGFPCFCLFVCFFKAVLS